MRCWARLAWLFSYVRCPPGSAASCPAWCGAACRRNCNAYKLALELGEPAQAYDLPWRLARREAYDSLSALATQRSLAEPAGAPPLAPLETVQARSYQLLAQLTAIKSLLLLRRSQLDHGGGHPALQAAARQIDRELAASAHRTCQHPRHHHRRSRSSPGPNRSPWTTLRALAAAAGWAWPPPWRVNCSRPPTWPAAQGCSLTLLNY